MPDTIDVYEDAAGGHRWRRQAPNGEVLSSGESFTRKADAWRAARRANPDLFPDDGDEVGYVGTRD